MKKRKLLRFIAVLMTLTLLLGMLPAAALAEGGNELPIQPVTGFDVTPTTITAVGTSTGFQWHFVGETEWYTDLVRTGLYPNTTYNVEYKVSSSASPVTKEVKTAQADYIKDRNATTLDSKAVYSFKQSGTNLTVAFQNSFNLVYYFPVANYSSYSNVRILVQRETFNDATSKYEYAQNVVEMSSLSIDEKNRYYLINKGITSSQLGDKVFITIYAEKDGVTYISDCKGYSVAEYCYLRLKSSASTTAEKTMCIDVLNYGDAAQIYFDDNTSHLVTSINSDLYNQYKDLATKSNPSTWSDILEKSGTAGDAAIKSIAIAFDSTTKLVFKFELSGSATADNIKVISSYESNNPSIGTVKKTYSGSAIKYDSSTKRYYIVVDNILTSDFDCPVTVQVLKDDVVISNTVSVNISHYCLNQYNNAPSNSLKNLVSALMDYSISATAYFN